MYIIYVTCTSKYINHVVFTLSNMYNNIEKFQDEHAWISNTEYSLIVEIII